jgi:hypothetical protein
MAAPGYGCVLGKRVRQFLKKGDTIGATAEERAASGSRMACSRLRSGLHTFFTRVVLMGKGKLMREKVKRPGRREEKRRRSGTGSTTGQPPCRSVPFPW